MTQNNTAEQLNTSTHNKLRSSLMKALSKIGHFNGHNVPVDASDLDNDLHELYVASEGKAYFDKRHKIVLEKITTDEHTASNIEAAAIGDTVVVDDGGVYYDLMLKKNNPSFRFDKTKMKNELRKAGVDPAIIEKAFAASLKETAPPKRFTVVSRS